MYFNSNYSYFMENHSTAILAWIKHGIHGMRCVHVDAHLDVGWVSNEAIRCVSHSRSDRLLGMERDCFLHTKEGGFDVSCWLSLALSSGMIRELVWVIPDELWFTDATVLQHMLAKEIGSINPDSLMQIGIQSNGRYHFVAYDVEIIVCRLDDLPTLAATEPVILDIDLDYFAKYRSSSSTGNWSLSWRNVEALVCRIGEKVPRVEILTIAASRHGGYLPESFYPYFDYFIEEVDDVVKNEVWDRNAISVDMGYRMYTKACGLLHRKRMHAAMTAVLSAIEVSDNEFGAYFYLLAVVSDALGQRSAAESAMEKAMSCNDMESAQVLNDFAGIHCRLGNLDYAVELQIQALSADLTESAIVSGNLMSLYCRRGDWESAQAMARVTLLRQPFNSEALVVIATAAQLRNDRQLAAQAWRDASQVTFDRKASARYLDRCSRLEKRML